MSLCSDGVPAHNVFTFGGITFSSNFDNGNLAKVEQIPNNTHSFRIWTAPDNMGSEHQSKHCAWYYFMVSGLPQGCVLRIQIVNTSNHSGLYKYDMRPVYRSNATNQRWVRIKSSVRFSKDASTPQLFFEHGVEVADDKLFFAFTYPYTYSMVQTELAQIDATHVNNFREKGSIFYQRELVTNSLDKRRIDLLTITSVDGRSATEREPLLSGLFPESRKVDDRPPVFPEKEIVFVSARVHSGEVPAQHTFKGILSLLMDPNDLRAKELRARYVFKLIPMLNPDGVYRGHFRMDQLGQNLNRYYTDTDPLLQPAIFAAKSLTDHFAALGKLSVYLDFHAHASKRGCFIYGNVLDTAEDQIQNQLYCKLIALNSAHFDYEGCLFSKDHMTRIDPGDQAKGLTAEGSGRVSMYLAHGIIHSYTIECNYNTSRVGNEIAPCDNEPGGECVTPPSAFTTSPDKYTPAIFAGVGRACVIALLDIRGHNPCSRISKSKFKTLDRVRNTVMMEVRSRKEYMGKAINKDRRRNVVAQERKHGDTVMSADDLCWRRVVESAEPSGPPALSNNNPNTSSKCNVAASDSGDGVDRSSEIFFIPMKDPRRRRRSGSALPEAQVSARGGGLSSDNSAYNSSNNSSRSETPRSNITTSPSPLRSNTSSGKAAPPMPPKVTTHIGDNTCLPVNAFTPHLGRRTVNASAEGRGLQDLQRESSSGRLVSPFGPAPDSRSSTPGTYGANGSAALSLPTVSSSVGSNLKDLALQSTPLLCPTGKRITPTAPQSNISSSASVSSSASSKVGRNILGKKLHAAGVALLMGNGSLSFNSLDGLDQVSEEHSGHRELNHQGHQGQQGSADQAGDSIDHLTHYQLRPASNPPPSMRPLSAGGRSPRAQREQALFAPSAQGIAVEEDFAFLSLEQNLPAPSPHGLRRQNSGSAISPVKSIRSPVANKSPKDN